MSRNHITITIFVAILLGLLCSIDGRAGAPVPSKDGPDLGKWQFTGKDDASLAWTGFLTIEKLDATRFDPKRYFAVCSLEVTSSDPAKGTRSVEAPCVWDAGKRLLSFTTGVSTLHSYTAILSPDGTSLLQGQWTESREKAVVRTGTWSAKHP